MSVNVSSSSLVLHIYTQVVIARRCVNPKKHAYFLRPKKICDRSLDPKRYRGCKFSTQKNTSDLHPGHVYCKYPPSLELILHDCLLEVGKMTIVISFDSCAIITCTGCYLLLVLVSTTV